MKHHFFSEKNFEASRYEEKKKEDSIFCLSVNLPFLLCISTFFVDFKLFSVISHLKSLNYVLK